jgi:transposase
MKNQQSANVARSQEKQRIWESRRQEIMDLYVNGDCSQREIGDRYGVTQGCVYLVLKRLGIPAKSRSRIGHKNGRFKDGTQSTAYRAMVEKKYCNRCGTTRALVIHHIDGVHTNNVESNLEVLCSPCHSRHHKQEWWNAQKAAAVE